MRVLGRETLAALDACRFEPEFDYSDVRRSDWPAYAASGERSIERLEQRWRRLRVAGANEHNLTWVVSVTVAEGRNLELTATVAPTTDLARLGDTIRYVDAQAERYLAR